jgi:hypothetical protein
MSYALSAETMTKGSGVSAVMCRWPTLLTLPPGRAARRGEARRKRLSRRFVDPGGVGMIIHSLSECMKRCKNVFILLLQLHIQFIKKNQAQLDDDYLRGAVGRSNALRCQGRDRSTKGPHRFDFSRETFFGSQARTCATSS